MAIFSIRTKIIVIVLVFLSLIGTAFIFYSFATTVNYKRLRLENINKTLEFETEKVNKVIAELERGALFYSTGGLLCYDLKSEDFGETFVKMGLMSLPSAVGGGFWYAPYIFNKDKLRVSSYAFIDKASGEARIDNAFNMDEYDYHRRNWYNELSGDILKPNQVIWTKPYVDDSGSFSLMTTAGAGIFKDGVLVGVTTVDWEIEEVIKQLLDINPTKNSFVLLCVPDKDYIISSAKTESFVGDSISEIPWDIHSDYFNHNGISYMRFGRFMNNGWLLSIQIPEKEIFAEMERHNSIFSVIIELSFVAMLAIAYILISRFINTPIKHLTDDVAQIGLGNLDTQIDIKSKDEFGQLAQTFNKMTSDLKKSIEENAREREEKKRISTELSVAKDIQLSMLPGVFPAFPERDEFDIYATMIPAREVGGDFYDFYLLDNDNLAVLIADVSGKGIPASLFMVNAKTLINNFSAGKSPKTAIESVNKKLCKNNDACIFVTAFMGIYNIPTGKLTYVNAGHNPPLVKKKDGSFDFLKTKPCMLLAINENAKYREDEIYLKDGDAIYLYTDGVTEAMNNNKELFGEQRLKDALNKDSSASPFELLCAVKNEVDNFSAGAEQADDIAMLALSIGKDCREPAGKITLNAELENLQSLIAFLNGELEKNGYNYDEKNKIEIAAEEVFMNIVKYAYDPSDENRKISITTSGSIVNRMIKITFEDAGRPYNPLETPPPDLQKPLADREIGGLGVHMIKTIMDKVEYTRLNDKNILVITAHLKR
ncbi:MAG: SpoIIE family protein phosphatase [Treponema sp.]|nr:SpoIIE family protein phosphatase [Treponema sp.]